jgi:signal transduction histidine kinase
MTSLLPVRVTEYSNRKFLVIISIVISALIIDISLSNISDLISVSTSWGFVTFIAIAIVYAIGQYLILDFVKQKSKNLRFRLSYFDKLSKIMTIVQYVLIAIIVFIIIQMFVNSYYPTSTLTWSSSISYTVAGALMMTLALKFFSWYRSNRNLVVLLYGISSIINSISIISSLVFFTIILQDMPSEIISPSPTEFVTEQEEVGHSEQEEVGHSEQEEVGHSEQEEVGHSEQEEVGHSEQEEVGHGPDIRKFDQSTISGKVQIVYVVSHILSFMLLWGSTAMLLYTYSKKLGKVKFWIIIIIPLASFLSIFVIVTPFVVSVSHESSDIDMFFIIIVDALGYSLPAAISSVLFGLPFFMIAKRLNYDSVLKDFMIIAGSGFALFALASSGNVILAPYPPLGLASVSFVGLSCYLILIGIYYSTISMSEDVKLRQAIRKSAANESKILVRVGSDHIEQKLEKKVIRMAKDHAASMTEQTGVQLSLTENDMKQYLSRVLREIKVLQNIDEILRKGKDILESSMEFLACSKFSGMRLVYNNYFNTFEEVMVKYRNGQHQGIRWITSIKDKDSADLVKMFLDIGVRIRHVKNMPPIDFAVSDKVIMATIEKMEGGEMAQSLLVSNELAYINHFTSIFEELWKNGIDASDRIRDIEEGVDQANIEIISNPKEGINRAWNIMKSAKEEVLIMFSSTNAARSLFGTGGLQFLKEASDKNGAKVRVVIPADEGNIMPAIMKEMKLIYPQIDIRMMDRSLQTRISIVLADRRECVIVELKDDTEHNYYKAAGITTYSDSNSIVSSYISIFESFWKQTELNEKLEELNKQFAEANKQLKIHNKIQNDFINIAAHELRTPIQPILGLSELLRSKIPPIGGSGEGDEQKILDAIIRNARRLQRLTEDILDVTRIESHSLKLRKERFNLNELISNTVQDHRNEIEKNNKDIKLSEEFSNQDIILEADRSRITQVLSNLVGNAIKFTTEGTISIRSQRKDNQVIVSIKDTGSGIDHEILSRLFSKFTAKSFEGTGLGLFISKNIIEAHGGKIWAENNNDAYGEKGATFYFMLPLIDRQQLNVK